jgi:hypothetical protein
LYDTFNRSVWLLGTVYYCINRLSVAGGGSRYSSVLFHLIWELWYYIYIYLYNSTVWIFSAIVSKHLMFLSFYVDGQILVYPFLFLFLKSFSTCTRRNVCFVDNFHWMCMDFQFIVGKFVSDNCVLLIFLQYWNLTKKKFSEFRYWFLIIHVFIKNDKNQCNRSLFSRQQRYFCNGSRYWVFCNLCAIVFYIVL